MRLFIGEKALGKARARLGRYGAYDPQDDKKKSDKWGFALQMREKGFLKLHKQPLYLNLVSHVQMPKSWTEAKRNDYRGHPCIVTPDIDNCVKYYCDVLNGIAYEDDSHISHLWAEKIYWDTPSVEINLTPMGGDMIQEHVITVKGEINLSTLEYMAKKAHRIGLSGRNLVRVYTQEDGEGTHYYFECEDMKRQPKI